MRTGGFSCFDRQRVPPVTHTHALFADQSQSILANRMELSGQGRACDGSAEAAQRAVVYVIGEQPDLVATNPPVAGSRTGDAGFVAGAYRDR